MTRLLIANRGEIAIRVARAAAELGWHSIAIYPEDDATSLHLRRTNEARLLPGNGARAYLDIEAVVAVACEAGADVVHPGYGFLAENPAFARAVEDAGMAFAGPGPETLALFGDKVRARRLAEECDVPILPGTGEPVGRDEARAFLETLPDGVAMLLKAAHGGGGRGVRVVRSAAELDEAFERAASEARMAFGNPELYAEAYVERARHVEVQIVGDGRGGVSHLFERECSLQRRYQKLVEIAPSPNLDDARREVLFRHAVRLGEAVGYRGLGTIEFLLDEASSGISFIEANARLQVEHTVTEETVGVDLVRAQLEIATGASLAEIGLVQADIPPPRGYAIEARINAERMGPDGSTRPSGGTLSVFEPPDGPGVRTDTYACSGYRLNPAYDSLIAKLVCHSPSPRFQDAVSRMLRALGELRIEGVETNRDFLVNLVRHEAFARGDVHTRFVDEHAVELAAAAAPTRHQAGDGEPAPGTGQGLAGTRLESIDPLAVLEHGKGGGGAVGQPRPALESVQEALPDGVVAVTAPMQGTVVGFEVEPGDEVWVGRAVLVIEAMKMEHLVRAGVSGVVQRLGANVGDTVYEGHPLIYLEEREVLARDDDSEQEIDLERIRPDLAEVFERRAAGLDENRPDAVARRHKTGHRTARENIADLCDPGSFVEYGSIVLAAQRRRRSIEDLIANTTGDGMVCGLGHINGDLFEPTRSRAMVMSYDYMVLAGTQGMKNHAKKDRMFEIAAHYRLPTVLFAEGGGGRPGDTDGSGVAGLDCWAFTYFARLSGLVPLVGITTGRCFAGNAVLLGCCDVIIATEDSNIGMGGPAMIEGGGLGVFDPSEIGPIDVQRANGVVDIVATDEEHATAVAKQCLSYFQGRRSDWRAPDQTLLRDVVPLDRLRAYDIGKVIEVMLFRQSREGATESSGMREAPLSMLIPMYVLVIVGLYFGINGSATLDVAGQAASQLLGGLQ